MHRYHIFTRRVSIIAYPSDSFTKSKGANQHSNAKLIGTRIEVVMRLSQILSEIPSKLNLKSHELYQTIISSPGIWYKHGQYLELLYVVLCPFTATDNLWSCSIYVVKAAIAINKGQWKSYRFCWSIACFYSVVFNIYNGCPGALVDYMRKFQDRYWAERS